MSVGAIQSKGVLTWPSIVPSWIPCSCNKSKQGQSDVTSLFMNSCTTLFVYLTLVSQCLLQNIRYLFRRSVEGESSNSKKPQETRNLQHTYDIILFIFCVHVKKMSPQQSNGRSSHLHTIKNPSLEVKRSDAT